MYSEPTETIKKRNTTIEIFQDEYCDSDPREWDNLGTMVCWHSRYNLGDKQECNTPQQFLVSLAESVIEPYDTKVNGWYTHELWEWAAYDNIPNDEDSGYPLNALQELVDKHFIVLPLYLYDHSGLTMNTTGFYCPWDSGQVGYIYVSKEQVREEYNWKNLTKQRIAKIESYLQGEVEIYDLYLQNRIYFFVATCDLCGKEDSCGGFYGEEWKENGLLDHIYSHCSCEESAYAHAMGVVE